MKIFLLWGAIFSLTRLPFINYGQVFFDSGEYLERLSNPNLFQALVMGHVPLHAGYILVYWPVWQVFSNIGGNPAQFVVLLQIFISFLGVWAFYKISKELLTKRAALLAAILISLTPMFWITNVTVMMESLYVSCFFISLWVMILFLKKNEMYLSVLGSIVLFISFLTHLAPLLYMPIYIFIVLFVSKKYRLPSSNVYSLLTVIAIAIVGFSCINSYLLDQNSMLNGLKTLYFGKTQEASPFEFSLIGIGRYLRNWIVPMMRNATIILFFASFLAFWKSYKRNDLKIFTLGLLWLLPSFLVNQWADSLWYGRHALISIFGVVFLASYLLDSKLKTTMLILIYLLVITTPQMFLLRGAIPYLELQRYAETLGDSDLYIESHYARPHIEKVRTDNVYYVNEPRDQGDLIRRIESAFENRGSVYISSQALSEPYGLYSGPYLHILSLSYRNDPTLKNLLGGNYDLIERKVINKEENLVIYELLESNKLFRYPEFGSLKDSQKRIDYFDPVMLLRFWLL